MESRPNKDDYSTCPFAACIWVGKWIQADTDYDERLFDGLRTKS